MFEQLFPGPKALARQRDGPLAERRQDYLTHLAQQGMSRATLVEAAYYLLIVAEQLRLAQRPEQAIPLSPRSFPARDFIQLNSALDQAAKQLGHTSSLIGAALRLLTDEAPQRRGPSEL